MPSPDNQDELSKQTLAKIIPAFILDRRTRGLAKGSIHFYQDELNRFAAWTPTKTIVDITPDELRGYLDHLGETRNHGGVHSAWRAIRALFHWFEAEFEPDNWRNPVSKIHIPGPSRQAIAGVDLTTIQKLIDVCDTDQVLRDQSILLILLDTGARATEFINLNIEDLDYATGALRIQRGKGGKPRTVYLGARSRRILRKYLKTRSAEPEAPLIATDDGGAIYLQWIGIADAPSS